MKLHLGSGPLAAVLLIYSASALPLSPKSGVSVPAHLEDAGCDAECTDQIIRDVAYSACASGIELAMTAYNATHWCAQANNSWCRDTISSNVDTLAQKAAESSGVTDLGDCDDVCLLSALELVSRNGALWSMRWAEETLNATGRPDESELATLHWSEWMMSQETQAVDADALQKAAQGRTNFTIPARTASRHNCSNAAASAIAAFSSTSTLLRPYTDSSDDDDDDKKHLAAILGTVPAVFGSGSFLTYLLAKARLPPGTGPTYPQWTTDPGCGGVDPIEPTVQTPPEGWSPPDAPVPPPSPPAETAPGGAPEVIAPAPPSPPPSGPDSPAGESVEPEAPVANPPVEPPVAEPPVPPSPDGPLPIPPGPEPPGLPPVPVPDTPPPSPPSPPHPVEPPIPPIEPEPQPHHGEPDEEPIVEPDSPPPSPPSPPPPPSPPVQPEPEPQHWGEDDEPTGGPDNAPPSPPHQPPPPSPPHEPSEPQRPETPPESGPQRPPTPPEPEPASQPPQRPASPPHEPAEPERPHTPPKRPVELPATPPQPPQPPQHPPSPPHEPSEPHKPHIPQENAPQRPQEPRPDPQPPQRPPSPPKPPSDLQSEEKKPEPVKPVDSHDDAFGHKGKQADQPKPAPKPPQPQPPKSDNSPPKQDTTPPKSGDRYEGPQGQHLKFAPRHRADRFDASDPEQQARVRQYVEKGLVPFDTVDSNGHPVDVQWLRWNEVTKVDADWNKETGDKKFDRPSKPEPDAEPSKQGPAQASPPPRHPQPTPPASPFGDYPSKDGNPFADYDQAATVEFSMPPMPHPTWVPPHGGMGW